MWIAIGHLRMLDNEFLIMDLSYLAYPKLTLKRTPFILET